VGKGLNMVFSIKESNNKKTKSDIKYLSSGIMLIFSLAAITLALFLGGFENVEKTEYYEDEISEVFKQTFFYDFLELDECKTTKMSGEVSDFGENSDFNNT
jgi:hypothetical protein